MNSRIYPADHVFLENRVYDTPLGKSGGVLNNSDTKSPDGSFVSQVSNVPKRWTDDFPGVALRPSKWTVETQTGSMVLAVANSDLVITTGTVINSVLSLLSQEVFTVPFDAHINTLLSQRVANQTFFFEAVQVDPTTLLPIPNPNLGTDWNNRAALRIDGAVATTYGVDVIGDGSGVLNQVVSAGQVTSAARADFSLEVRTEDVSLSSVATDAATAKSAATARNSRQGVDSDALYKIRLRAVNGPVAPTSTVWTIGRVAVVDSQEMIVEVSSGRGDVSGSKAVGVNIAGQNGNVNVNLAASAAAQQVYGQASATANGATNHRLLAAASINATIVKAGAGRLLGGSIKNRAAAERFAKFYNKATAPAPATDAALLVAVFPLAAGERVDLANVVGVYGMSFAAGISYVLVTGVADADVAICAANDLAVNLTFA